MANLKLSERMGWIKPSPSVAANNRAMELKAAGKDILNLAAGEPDSDTPLSIKEAGIEAIRSGRTKYTQTAGDPDFRRAVAAKCLEETGIEYGIDQVQVSNGAKQILYHALTATVGPGDEVIIPTPFWVSYPDMVSMQGATPVIAACRAEDEFKLTPALLESVITPKTRWLIFNVPNNPGGAVYTEDEVRGLCEVLRRHPHVWLATDDIYEVLRFEGEPVSPLRVAPDLADRTLIINGVSKTYAMTGWRIGYGVGPKPLISAMNIVQSQVCTSASSIAQYAATHALTGDQSFVSELRNTYKERARLAYDLLSAIPGVMPIAPKGGLFVFANCEGLIGKVTPDGKRIETDTDVVGYLLESQGAIMVEGSAFGAPGHFRFSIAISSDTIRQGCERIRLACAELA